MCHHSLISTDGGCCISLPPLTCTYTEAEYFLFSNRLVNVATTLLLPSDNMSTVLVEALTQELRQA